MKYSAYTKEFSGLYFAFEAFRYIIWGNQKPTLVLTDNKSLSRFFQAKHMAPSLWNHIDFILQFDFIKFILKLYSSPNSYGCFFQIFVYNATGKSRRSNGDTSTLKHYDNTLLNTYEDSVR